MEATNNNVPLYQSIKDTAKVTGLSQFMLRKLLKDGKLPHIRSGNKIFVNIPALTERLKQMESGGDSI